MGVPLPMMQVLLQGMISCAPCQVWSWRNCTYHFKKFIVTGSHMYKLRGRWCNKWISIEDYFYGWEGSRLGWCLFAAFWEVAYQRLFEGASQLIPVLHAQTASSWCWVMLYPMVTLCVVICQFKSHYLVCSWSWSISNSMLMDALCNSISPVEASFLKGCFSITSSAFSSGVQAKLISLLSRFGSREVPTPTT